jgi:hypothetical protein
MGERKSVQPRWQSHERHALSDVRVVIEDAAVKIIEALPYPQASEMTATIIEQCGNLALCVGQIRQVINDSLPADCGKMPASELWNGRIDDALAAIKARAARIALPTDAEIQMAITVAWLHDAAAQECPALWGVGPYKIERRTFTDRARFEVTHAGGHCTMQDTLSRAIWWVLDFDREMLLSDLRAYV